MHKNIIALGWVSFFTDMATAMITPLIPIFVVVILHEDTQRLGEIVAITTFASYALRLVFGYLGDKYQITKPFVVTGYLISAVTKPMFYWVTSWQHIALLQTTERTGKAIRSASKDSLISAFAMHNNKGKAFGFHKMMDISGELAGALIIFAALSWFGQTETMLKGIFAWTVLPGVLAVGILLFFVQDAPHDPHKESYKWQAADKALLPLLGIYFIFLVFIFNSAFVVIKANDLGYNLALIPLLFIVLNLSQTLASYPIGLAADRIGAVNVLLIAFGFGALCQLSLWFSWLWLAMIFLGLFTVCSLNGMRTYISQKAKNKATIFGIFYAGSAIFSAIGALFVGYLWSHFGDQIALQITSLSTVTLTLILLVSKWFRGIS